MKFSYRLHKSGSENILAIADADIVGKKFEEGNFIIEVAEDFYSGRVCTEKDVPSLVESASIINAVGKEAVGMLISSGMVDKNMVLDIGGIFHAQVVKV